MANAPNTLTVEGVCRTTQIIVISLVMGVLFFGGVAVTQGAGGIQIAGNVLPIIGVVFAVMGVAAGFVVSRAMVQSGLSHMKDGTYRSTTAAVSTEDEAIKLASIFQTTTIVRCALLEGPAFLNIFAYMSDGTVYSLVVAGVLCVGILLHFPTSNSLRFWIDSRLQELRRE